MGLPTKAIDRIFERLTLAYGVQFMAQYEGIPTGQVKTDWCEWLSAYAGRLDAVAWALDNLPERPTNALQFRNLCRLAPAIAVPALPEPAADPARIAAELAKLAPLRQAVVSSVSVDAVDSKAWARRLVARHDAGDRLNPTSLRFAREALRLTVAGVAA